MRPLAGRATTVTENVTEIEMLGAIVPTSIPALGLALS